MNKPDTNDFIELLERIIEADDHAIDDKDFSDKMKLLTEEAKKLIQNYFQA